MNAPETQTEGHKPRAKVFGIGFHKTGTKSLAHALTALGYRVTGPNGIQKPHIAKIYPQLCRRLSHKFDGFQDNPWPLVYADMSEMWPDAKFVLTVRDKDGWIASVKSHFGPHSTPMRELIYGVGSPIGNERLYIDRMQQHEDEVLTFFASQPERLLTLRITAGQGYEALCPFLELDIPDTPFPRKNSKQTRGQRT